MGFLQRLFKDRERLRRDQLRQERREEIESLGFTLIERHGWHEGKHADRRYFIGRGDQIVAGPFSSSNQALIEARKLASERP